MCLLDVLYALAPELGFDLVAGHVNHGLRAGSDAEARVVKDVASDYGLDVLVRRVKVQNRGMGLEAEARDARYEALADMAHTTGANRIATGHTATDQAETLLYRLMRGTGLKGLTGIRLREGAVIRPLMGIQAHETRAYMQALGRPFLHDESNDDTRFDRNFIRHRVLPLLEMRFPGAGARIADIAVDMASLRPLIEQRASDLLQEALVLHEGESLVLDAASLLNLDAYWLAEVMSAMGRMLYGHPDPLTRRHLGQLIGMIGAQTATSILSLPLGYIAFKAAGMLNITRIPPAPFDPVVVHTGVCRAGIFSFRCDIIQDMKRPGDLWSAVFPADLEGRIVLRPPRLGDRVRPLGMTGTKKVFRVLMDAKIPSIYRQLWPVAVLQNEVLWVPGAARSRFGLYESGPALQLLADPQDPVLARVTSDRGR